MGIIEISSFPPDSTWQRATIGLSLFSSVCPHGFVHSFTFFRFYKLDSFPETHEQVVPYRTYAGVDGGIAGNGSVDFFYPLRHFGTCDSILLFSPLLLSILGLSTIPSRSFPLSSCFILISLSYPYLPPPEYRWSRLARLAQYSQLTSPPPSDGRACLSIPIKI